MLSNNGLHLRTTVMLLFLVLVVNSDRFQILWSYMLLLKPPVLMHSCTCYIHKVVSCSQHRHELITDPLTVYSRQLVHNSQGTNTGMKLIINPQSVYPRVRTQLVWGPQVSVTTPLTTRYVKTTEVSWFSRVRRNNLINTSTLRLVHTHTIESWRYEQG